MTCERVAKTERDKKACVQQEDKDNRAGDTESSIAGSVYGQTDLTWPGHTHTEDNLPLLFIYFL